MARGGGSGGGLGADLDSLFEDPPAGRRAAPAAGSGDLVLESEESEDLEGLFPPQGRARDRAGPQQAGGAPAEPGEEPAPSIVRDYSTEFESEGPVDSPNTERLKALFQEDAGAGEGVQAEGSFGELLGISGARPGKGQPRAGRRSAVKAFDAPESPPRDSSGAGGRAAEQGAWSLQGAQQTEATAVSTFVTEPSFEDLSAVQRGGTFSTAGPASMIEDTRSGYSDSWEVDPDELIPDGGAGAEVQSRASSTPLAGRLVTPDSPVSPGTLEGAVVAELSSSSDEQGPAADAGGYKPSFVSKKARGPAERRPGGAPSGVSVPAARASEDRPPAVPSLGKSLVGLPRKQEGPNSGRSAQIETTPRTAASTPEVTPRTMEFAMQEAVNSEKHTAEVESLKRVHAGDLESLRRSHAKEMESLERSHAEERGRLQGQLQGAQSELEAARRETAATQSRMSALERDLEDTRSPARGPGAGGRAEAEALRRELESKSRQLETLREEVSRSERARSSFSDRSRSLEALTEKVERAVSSAQSLDDRLSQSHDRSMRERADHILELEARLLSRENRLSSREKDADRLKEELEGLAENLRAESRAGQLHLEEENRRLGQEQARLDKLAAALSSERTELQAEMARERKTVEDLKASAARHKARTQESCLEEQKILAAEKEGTLKSLQDALQQEVEARNRANEVKVQIEADLLAFAREKDAAIELRKALQEERDSLKKSTAEMVLERQNVEAEAASIANYGVQVQKQSETCGAALEEAQRLRREAEETASQNSTERRELVRQREAAEAKLATMVDSRAALERERLEIAKEKAELNEERVRASRTAEAARMAELKLQRHMRKYAVQGVANPLGPGRDGNAGGVAQARPQPKGASKKSKARHKSRSLFKQLLEQHQSWETERQQSSRAMQTQQKYLTDASFSAAAEPALLPASSRPPPPPAPIPALVPPRKAAVGAENVDPALLITDLPSNLSSDVQELYSSMVDFGLISQNLGLHDFPSETTALSDTTPFATTDSEPGSTENSEAES